jgi:hypothetical protein
VIGQPPRFALTTPTFRFRSLAAASGRAALGGDRETLLACLQLGRLCAGILKPYEIPRDILMERIPLDRFRNYRRTVGPGQSEVRRSF